MNTETDTERGNELITAALWWLHQGISVVPAQPRSKAIYMSWHKYESLLPGDDLAFTWFQSGVMNLAVIAGTGRLQVLDFENQYAYSEWVSRCGDLSQTYTEITGKGYHVFFLVDKPISLRISESIELLGEYHACNVAPSIHPSGHIYHVMPEIPRVIKPERSKTILLSLGAQKTLPNTAVNQAVNRSINPRPGSLVDAIKIKYPLGDYAETLTELKPSGKGYLIGRCPLHDDKLPSFWVDVNKGIWGCFASSCPGQRGGDVINLYSLVNHIPVRAAILQLAGKIE